MKRKFQIILSRPHHMYKKIKHTSHQPNDDESSPNCIKYLSFFCNIFSERMKEKKISQSLWLLNLSGHKRFTIRCTSLVKKGFFYISDRFLLLMLWSLHTAYVHVNRIRDKNWGAKKKYVSCMIDFWSLITCMISIVEAHLGETLW